MHMSMGFKKLKNKILVHLKSFDITIDHILVHFVGSKQGLYVSFRIPLYSNKYRNADHNIQYPALIVIENQVSIDLLFQNIYS